MDVFMAGGNYTCRGASARLNLQISLNRSMRAS
jgi:hypothetical protein